MMLIPLFWIHCSRYVHLGRGGGEDVHAVFSDKFMTQSILDSIDMKYIHIFYDHYHLKFNLEKSLLMK